MKKYAEKKFMHFPKVEGIIKFITSLYTPVKEVQGGCIEITLCVCLSVRLSV